MREMHKRLLAVCMQHISTNACDCKQTRPKATSLDTPQPCKRCSDLLGTSEPHKTPELVCCPFASSFAFRQPAIQARKDSTQQCELSRLWQMEPAGSAQHGELRPHRQGQKRVTILSPRDCPFACRQPALEATNMTAHDNAKISTPQQKEPAGSA